MNLLMLILQKVHNIWSKLTVRGVSAKQSVEIVFHVELAPLGGILGPRKSDLGVFWAKIPLYPYNVKTQKTHFLKTLS